MGEIIQGAADQHYAVPCIICGTFVDLNDRERQSLEIGHYRPVKVCKECKDAMAFIKLAMKNAE